MAEMPPVELLRSAAARVREVGAAASAGPWTTGGDGLVWAPRIGDPVSGSTDETDADWIALMHPGLAEPLAAMFDRFAWVLKFDADLIHRVGTEEVVEAARVLLGVSDGR